MPNKKMNLDAKVVGDFGMEWETFDQTVLTDAEVRRIFESYFAIFPWNELPSGAEGFDLGCGSGRWAKLFSERVGRLNCVDPSERALAVARRALAGKENCNLILASVDALPMPDNSMDFGYSLGVLHHVPDVTAGIRSCVQKLKPGAPLLLYLYYRFDNRPWWFVVVWRVSDFLRRVISKMPFALKYIASQAIALLVYFPLARASLLLEKCGVGVSHFPLSAYRDKSFYVMRTDALDRFGTRLEKRFTRSEIKAMMAEAGLIDIEIGENEPYWCAVGRKAPQHT